MMDEEAYNADCPVCYESFSDSARTLSCGHSFCHDCLVGTFVSSNRDGVITRDTIICPVCRHVTFVTKLQGLGGEKEKHRKRLEVPLMFVGRSASAPGFSGGRYRRLGRCLRWISCRIGRQRLVYPKDSSQVFIISDLGRPLTEEDVIDVGTSVVIHENSTEHGCICTASHCLLVLLIIFTLLALIAATLPWVFLA
ncbi:RING finger protein 222 [Hemibagrus wyckioides]|uniref:RING finger protein 222 n=1 Tax=Hemibagrus wyckioides TaxID=337641 RepID=UPI00266C13B4|nr:RING finger protein 222 [Hemibagrus wyckioides]XP_058269810.1 RING finger protein 222 [Hemibagrus wyckioides]